MQKQSKKLIAPILITTLLVVYLLLVLIEGVSIPGLLVDKTIIIVVISALIGVSLYVLIERIKEIRSGEEDDLSKY